MGKRKRTRRNPKAGTAKPRANWISTAVPRTLAHEANELIKSGIGGYHSLTNLVEDAVRRRLEELRPKPEPEKVLGAVTA